MGQGHAAAIYCASDFEFVQPDKALDGHAGAAAQAGGDFGQQRGLDELLQRVAAGLVEVLQAGVADHGVKAGRDTLVVDVLDSAQLLFAPAAEEAGGREDVFEAAADGQEFAEWDVAAGDEEFVEEAEGGAVALEEGGDVDQGFDEGGVEGVDVAKIVFVALLEDGGQELAMAFDQMVDCVLNGFGQDGPEDALFDDVPQLDVFQGGGFEAPAVVVEVVVELVFVDHVGEEFAEAPLAGDEDGDGQGALTVGVVDDDVELVDGLLVFGAGLVGEPDEHFVEEEDDGVVPLVGDVLG